MEHTEVVYLVDDDSRVREALEEFLAVHNLRTKSFESASAFLSHHDVAASSCLILDLELAEVCGLELQLRLKEFQPVLPVIFVSGEQDVATSVKAMKAGAADFFTKPVDAQGLLQSVREALERDRRQRKRLRETQELQARFSLLTPREREVLPLVIGGFLNKQAAAILEIAEVTLQVHRGQVMRKMQANSLADLVRMAARLGIKPYKE